MPKIQNRRDVAHPLGFAWKTDLEKFLNGLARELLFTFSRYATSSCYGKCGLSLTTKIQDWFVYDQHELVECLCRDGGCVLREGEDFQHAASPSRHFFYIYRWSSSLSLQELAISRRNLTWHFRRLKALLQLLEYKLELAGARYQSTQTHVTLLAPQGFTPTSKDPWVELEE